MTQTEMFGFLKSGAVLRLPSGKVRIWAGPWKPTDFQKSQEISVSYAQFFGSGLESFESSQPVLETEVSELRRQLQSFLETQPSRSSFTSEAFTAPNLDGFRESFQIIQGKIHRGELEKAVPVTFARSSEIPGDAERAHMLFHALESHRGLYVFGTWNEQEGILGASPEILFHQQGSLLRTMALAGTLPKSSGLPKETLLKDPKELKEHRLVVEDISRRLEKLGWLKVGKTEVVEFPMLSHLKTEIEVETSPINAKELVQILHPTAALGVFPRNYGIQWLQALPDQSDRGIFGAPIVFSISRTECIAIVAIRCLQWDAKGSRIGAGCGLVKESDLFKEWQEIAAKRESVFRTLGLMK